MPQRQAITMIDVATALGGGEQGPFPFEQFKLKVLAQGDSWFSIGALPPGKTSNLLLEMAFVPRTVVVQTARPGKVLRLFTDTTREPNFLRMMNGPVASRWDMIFISGMGNDLIAAAGAAPAAPASQRLLLTPAERGGAPLQAAAYVSEPGWSTFTTHMRAVFNDLVDLRDRGPNLRVPLLMHNYARVMPRPSGAGLGQGPWLQPAFDAYAIPVGQRLALADVLLGRMGALIKQLMDERRSADPLCNLHLVDSMGQAGVALAEAGTTGSSGDWVNEIHLTREGYRKCAKVWAQLVEALAPG
jgi:hypothetical protein